LSGKICLTLNLTGLCLEKFFDPFFWGKNSGQKKFCCRAPSVLAGQFWQTPPELKGASFAHVQVVRKYANLLTWQGHIPHRSKGGLMHTPSKLGFIHFIFFR
jgi:hypothetical protein